MQDPASPPPFAVDPATRVSAVLSYEAERLMTGGRLDSYEKPDEQQRPLLRLTQSTSGVSVPTSSSSTATFALW